MPPVPPLPLPSAELTRRLSRPLATRPDGLELAIDEVMVMAVEGSRAPDLRLLLRITAKRGTDVRAQRWQVAVPLDRADLDPEVDVSAFVTTIRANVEEWWDRKASESNIAAWGHRVD